MKKIKFTCSHCQAKLRVPSHLAGVSAPCPKCGSTITAPNDFDEAEEEVSPAPASVASTPSPASAAKVSATVSAGQKVSGRVISAPQEPVPPEPESSPLPEPVPAEPAVAETEIAEPVETGPELFPEPPAISEPSLEEAYVEEQVITPPAADLPVESEPIVEETILVPPPAPDLPDSVAPPPPIVAPPVPEVAEAPSVGEFEEPKVAAEPPAIPKTQPIQINPNPVHLPPVREDAVEGGELPRLDVNLAETGEQGGASATMLSTPNGPTRVQLPAPGEEAHQFAPSDFIVPSGGSAPMSVPPEEPVSEIESTDPQFDAEIGPTYEEPPAVAEEMEEEFAYEQASPEAENYEEPPTFDPSSLLTEDPEAAALAETAPVPAVPMQVSVPHPDSGVPESVVEPPVVPAPDQYPDADSYPEEEPAPTLAEGSFENMLAAQPTGSQDMGESLPTPDAGLPFLGADQANATQPVENAGQVPAEQIAGPTKEADVLDDLFGASSAPREKAPTSKSTVLMLSILGAVAIIAVVTVVAVGMSMGGFSLEAPSGDQESPETAGEGIPDALRESSGASSSSVSGGIAEPSIDGAPAVIDPIAKPPVEEQPARLERSTTTLPGDTSQSVRIVDTGASETGNVEEMSAADVAPASAGLPDPGSPPPTPGGDPAAMSFEERVQAIVNGDAPAVGGTSQGALIDGSSSLDPVDGAISDFSNSLSAGNAATKEGVDLINGVTEQVAEAREAVAEARDAAVDAMNSGAPKNYNPPDSFPAPDLSDSNESRLGKTHDLLDAFLRAPDWQTRVKYIYQGQSLQPAIEEYYKKWPMQSYDKFAIQLFQMEQDPDLGGPYWVYQVSTSGLDQGFPVIVRVENGNLKVDWEIFSEFEDQHFVKFQKGAIASPHTMRLVIERVSDYYGSDRDGFQDLGDYYVYQVSPPYGDLNEFADYAFVKADSEVAAKLDKVVGLNDAPLAVIVTLEQQSFPHGVKHLVVSEYVTEGWFR